MAKKRVYELAQELGRQNKEIMDFLKSRGVDVKSHMSNVEEEYVRMTKEKMGNSEEPKKAENEVKEPVKDEGAPKKKKNIIRIFHAQNASDGGRDRFGKRERRPGDKKNPRPQAGNAQAKRPAAQPESRAQDGKPAEAQGKVQPETKTAAPAAASGSREVTAAASQAEKPAAKASGTGRPAQETRQQAGRSGQETRADGAKAPGRGQNQNARTGQNNGRGGRDFRSGQDGNKFQNGRQGQENRSQNQGGRAHGNRQNQEGGRFQGNRQNQEGGKFQGNRQNQEGGKFQGNRQNQEGGKFQGRGQGGRSQSQNSRAQKRQEQELFISEIVKPSKDPKRERDNKKDNKNKKDYEKGGNRPNQGGRRPNMRLPKALQKPAAAPKHEEKKPEVKEITLPEKMTIRELAEKMKMQPSVIVKKLFMEGIMVTVNHEIDFEKAQEIALDYDIIAEQEEKVDVIGELLKEEEEDESLLQPRPPVVCVMGHVDHGKTSLLDAIRNTNVTDKEAGGITQHIGAYVVKINDQKITFLDTPGHEAFTAMRMRGANATDIAILVVAADDGVMPQTVEAISHAKAAGTEIIVAINKIDKPSANVERVKQELSEYELIPEDWGGSTVFVPVSAKTGEGIENLLEMILLTAEVSELKANPKRAARGLVIEAELDKGKGPVATILVQKGTLHVGDFIAAGACSGKVRAMMDDKGRRVREAGPSTPVEILGLGDVPNAGEIIMSFKSDKEAKNFAATFVSENKNRLLEDTKAKLSLDDLFSQIQEGNLKELPIIVKADVQGSVEAVKQSLVKLSNDEVVVKVIHGGVGAINESDVTLAATSNAIIIGFNVRPDATAKSLAEQEGVDLRLYKVIYQAIEDVEAAMKGMLDPVYEEKIIGHGEVRQLFKASGVGTIAGSYVLDGVFQRNCKIRITREGEQIYEGALASLKRFKDDVKEVKAGYECGLVFENFNDVQEEDQVEAYIMVEVPR